MDDLLKTLPADDIQYQSTHSKQALSKLTSKTGSSAVSVARAPLIFVIHVFGLAGEGIFKSHKEHTQEFVGPRKLDRRGNR